MEATALTELESSVVLTDRDGAALQEEEWSAGALHIAADAVTDATIDASAPGEDGKGNAGLDEDAAKTAPSFVISINLDRRAGTVAALLGGSGRDPAGQSFDLRNASLSGGAAEVTATTRGDRHAKFNGTRAGSVGGTSLGFVGGFAYGHLQLDTRAEQGATRDGGAAWGLTLATRTALPQPDLAPFEDALDTAREGMAETDDAANLLADDLMPDPAVTLDRRRAPSRLSATSSRAASRWNCSRRGSARCGRRGRLLRRVPALPPRPRRGRAGRQPPDRRSRRAVAGDRRAAADALLCPGRRARPDRPAPRRRAARPPRDARHARRLRLLRHPRGAARPRPQGELAHRLERPLTLAATVCEGSQALTLSYGRVVSPGGARLTALWSGSRTENIDPPAVEGRTQSANIALTVPVIARADRTQSLSAGLAALGEESTLLGVDVLDQTGRNVILGLAGSVKAARASAPGGLHLFSGSYDDRVFDRDRDYIALAFSPAPSALFGTDAFVSATFGGQAALDGQMPSSRLFDVASPAAVRGYPTEIVSTDSGW